jgi:hypothetical protein
MARSDTKPELSPAEGALPTVFFVADGCVMGHWRNIAIVVWATQGTGALAAELVKLADMLNDKYPKTSSVHVILDAADMPDEDARVTFDNLVGKYARRLICAGVMIDGRGFWASAMRAIVMSFQLIERRRFHGNVFSNVRDLARWLTPLHVEASGEAFQPEQLESALNWMIEQPSVRKAR